MLFPDYFEPYKNAIPVEERGDMMKAYYKRLTGDNEEEKLKWLVFFRPLVWSFPPGNSTVGSECRRAGTDDTDMEGAIRIDYC